MKRAIYLILVFLGLTILTIRLGTAAYSYFFAPDLRAGIKVLSTPDGADVFVDGKSIGKTPFEASDLKAGLHVVKIQLADTSWQGKVNILGGTESIVNRELSADSSSSAGETLTLEQGKGVSLVSAVSGVDVSVDDKAIGKTPVTLNLEAGEHTFSLSHPGYLKRSIRALVPQGYNLVIDASLALTEADLSDVVTTVTTATAKVVVKNTPTGFLRVRDKAGASGTEIARVKPKDELVLLEEQSGWDRVRLDNGKEGFVSAAYVDKLP